MAEQFEKKRLALNRNEDQLYLALSSAHMGTWDWHPLDHTMHLDERSMRSLD
jgi:hypothetical protein